MNQQTATRDLKHERNLKINLHTDYWEEMETIHTYPLNFKVTS